MTSNKKLKWRSSPYHFFHHYQKDEKQENDDKEFNHEITQPLMSSLSEKSECTSYLEEKLEELIHISLYNNLNSTEVISLNIQPNFNRAFIVTSGIFAFISGLAIVYSGPEIGRRYIILAPEMRVFFLRIIPIFLIITTTLFNWQAFLSLGNSHASISAYGRAALTAFYSHPFKELSLTIISIASVLPLIIINGLKLNSLHIASNLVASIAGIFVNYAGVKACYQLTGYYKPQLLYYSLRLYISCLLRSDTSQSSESIKLAKIKGELIHELTECCEAFYYGSSLEKQRFIKLFSITENPNQHLMALIRCGEEVFPSAMPSAMRSYHHDYALRFIKYVVLCGLGLLQNFGHALVCWQAGIKIHPVFAFVLVCLNALPGIGYSVQGGLGFGLVEIGLELSGIKKPPLRQLMPWRYNACAFTLRIIYAMSGWGSDEMNSRGVRYCNGSLTAAVVVGILANFATAFVFNGPQCELFFRSILKKIALSSNEIQEQDKQSLRFQIKFQEITDNLKIASLQSINEIVTKDEELSSHLSI